MIFLFFAAGVAAVFFVGSLLLLHLGRSLGLKYRERGSIDAAAGHATVEGSIFGLMGLLLAFTISGALQRFDDRQQLVLQETNAAATAYDRLGVLGGQSAQDLRRKLRDYVLARVELYRTPHDFKLWQRAEDFSDAQEQAIVSRKGELWNAAVAACPNADFRPACSLALPALNTLFDVARLRAGASEKHPPQVIYFMLFGLGLGCSLLAGFGMASASARSPVHMVLFAGTLTMALYIVTDMEYPRLGLIRIEAFDHFLADVYEKMQ